ncbi:hypothetical protein MARINON1_52235 [Marinobacter salarius]|nr:hypothetical protein MARINON1_52235 [Marinobacter salarius]
MPELMTQIFQEGRSIKKGLPKEPLFLLRALETRLFSG